MSKEFTVGSAVKVPCYIQPGAFKDERLVSIDAEDGQISGFIQSVLIEFVDGEHGYLVGRIVNKDEGSLTVQLPGSFFTTATGRTSVSGDWAYRNLEPATAA